MWRNKWMPVIPILQPYPDNSGLIEQRRRERGVAMCFIDPAPGWERDNPSCDPFPFPIDRDPASGLDLAALQNKQYFPPGVGIDRETMEPAARAGSRNMHQILRLR